MTIFVNFFRCFSEGAKILAKILLKLPVLTFTGIFFDKFNEVLESAVV